MANLIYAGQKLCIPGSPVAMPYDAATASDTYAAPVVEPVVVAPVVEKPTASTAAPDPAAGNLYRVQHGDTLSAIAAQHGTTVAALMQSTISRSDPCLLDSGSGCPIKALAGKPAKLWPGWSCGSGWDRSSRGYGSGPTWR